MSNCTITVNQAQEVTKVVEVKSKHPGRVAQGAHAEPQGDHKLAELMRLRKIGLAPQKPAKITLKSILDEIRTDLNDPAAILTAIDETISILEKDYKTEIQIKLKKM